MSVLSNKPLFHMIRSVSAYATALVLLLALGACSSTDVLAPTMNVSVGQQLIDLKKARDSGAISQREWEQQKQRIIDSVK
jgi:hypothetical protein